MVTGQTATVAPILQSVFAGTLARSLCTFVTFPVAPAVVGLPADPSSISATIVDDAGNLLATLTSVKDAVGQYHADYPANTIGEFRIVWAGTGAVTATAIGLLTVNDPSAITAP